jgi:hypothetical protein
MKTPPHQLRRRKLRDSAAKKPKGHWPKGKLRNTGDAAEVKRLLDIAAASRQTSSLARRLGMERKNLWRYRSGRYAPPEGLAERIAVLVELR